MYFNKSILEMKQLLIKFIQFTSHKMGYDVALVKYTPGEIDMQGDIRLLKFINTVQYIQSKNTIKNK